MHNPLEQFLIKPIIKLELFGYDISFTNSSLCMVIVSFSLCAFMLVVASCLKVIPSKTQAFFESLHGLIANMIRDNVGEGGMRFFPIIFSIFLFVLFANLLGMLPYSFTVTSHVAVTFALAVFLFSMITITGFVIHGRHFLKLFLPDGIPSWLAPLIIVIEICAYLTKPFSLALRLAANMTAGHILLKVMASFAVSMWAIFKLAPIAVVTTLIGFEFCVALLQSYIFATLTCVYLNDAVNLH